MHFHTIQIPQWFALRLSFWLLAFQSNTQPYETPRVGLSAFTEAFRQGLRELGHLEGRMLSLSSDLEKGKLIASPRSRRELIFRWEKTHE